MNIPGLATASGAQKNELILFYTLLELTIIVVAGRVGGALARRIGQSAAVGEIIVGILLGRGVDARYLMACGLFVLALGNFWMSRLNLDISPWQVVWPRVVVILGLSMLFAPLNVAAFLYIPKQLRGGAVALYAFCARALRVTEFGFLAKNVAAKFGGQSGRH